MNLLVAPIAVKTLDVPVYGRYTVIMLPSAADPILDPLIAQQNRDQSKVRFAVGLHIAETPSTLHPIPGAYLVIKTDTDYMPILLHEPPNAWVNALTAPEIVLTTHAEIIRLVNVPGYKTVKLNRRLRALFDDATFPIAWRLRQDLATYLRDFLSAPPESAISHRWGAAFAPWLKASSMH